MALHLQIELLKPYSEYLTGVVVVCCCLYLFSFFYPLKVRWINPSWWTHLAISRFSQCSTTGVTKAVVCVILFVGWCM